MEQLKPTGGELAHSGVKEGFLEEVMQRLGSKG